TDCPCKTDQGYFVRQALPGDGSVTARVVTQQDTGMSPRAGVMMRDGEEFGSAYVSVTVVPGAGVRLQSNYAMDVATGDAAAPVWLRLPRGSGVITAYLSADGTAWTRVGTVDVGGWGTGAEAGLFVSSPGRATTVRITGGSQGGYVYTPSTAT